MSDIEDISLEAAAPVVPVVEIGHGGSNRSPRDHSDQDYDSEFESDEDDDTHSPQSTSRERRRVRNVKTVNGRVAVDMTPPDDKLRDAQNRAKKYSRLKKADKAIKEYVTCTALARIVYGNNHWKFAASHVDLAEAYLDLKGYAIQAEFHSDSAKDIMLHGVHTSSSHKEKADIYHVLIRVYYIMGKALTILKKYNEAEQALTKADRISQERSKLDCVTDDECDEIDIKLYLAMARLSSKQKKYAVASAHYDKVLELMEIRYGRDSLLLIPVYHDYGRLEQSKGRHGNHEKIIELFLQAHSIAGANHKTGSVELVDTALALAQAYASTGREEAEASAESYLNECQANCTAVHGPHHTKTLEVNDEIARLLIRTDRQDEAMTILKSSINPKSEVFGDYSEQVSDTYKMMASVHLSQGNIEKALRSYKKCHTIETLVLGKNHRKTKDTLRTMELLMASPGVSSKFVLNKEDELQKRPRFTSVVSRATPLGANKPQ
ncbi:tetratricopeptide repeat protein 23-like isoform X1 [Haliotis asinina]|uniref:tetratricopeptide repeat protein 23-like isoform X1 n=1 Tax=Haliotis asinina TaxID=109174 RepID=UPI0035325926